MPLSKDILGTDLYNVRNTFSNKTEQDLIATYGSIENARLAACKAEAEAIINHFKANSLLTIPALGFISASPGQPVTGTSVTGTIA